MARVSGRGLTMIPSLSTWLTRRRKLSEARKAFEAAKVEFDLREGVYRAAKARGDTRRMHEFHPPFVKARCAMIAAELAYFQTRFPHKRSERGTHEIARGFR